MAKVYFENISKEIESELRKAQNSILIAVAWLTNVNIIKILKEKALENVYIEVLTNNDDRNFGSGKELMDLPEYGIVINHYYSKRNLMHNKFCIIDTIVVITGSYNWTLGAKYNKENITVFSGENDMAVKFTNEFFRLKKFFNETLYDSYKDAVEIEKGSPVFLCLESINPYSYLIEKIVLGSGKFFMPNSEDSENDCQPEGEIEEYAYMSLKLRHKIFPKYFDDELNARNSFAYNLTVGISYDWLQKNYSIKEYEGKELYHLLHYIYPTKFATRFVKENN